MKCLFKYQWVKLPRNQLPSGKGIMGAWARLASRALTVLDAEDAFQPHDTTCPGSFLDLVDVTAVRGLGLKSILGIKNRQKAMDTLTTLSELGYVSHELDPNRSTWLARCGRLLWRPVGPMHP